MTRHITDHPKPAQGAARLRAYLNIERRLSGQSLRRSLLRQPRLAGSGKLRQFLRIEVGREA